MDTTWLIILGILLLVGLYLYNRNRTPPRGTYDDKNYRSGGSIGGGPGAYDDPDVRSGGSIGGRQSAYDSRDHESGGTFGGDSPEPRARRPVDTDQERPQYDSDEFESGGSIGGSTRRRRDKPER